MWQFKVSFTNITGLGEFCFQLEFSESKGCVSLPFSRYSFFGPTYIKKLIFFEDGKEISHILAPQHKHLFQVAPRVADHHLFRLRRVTTAGLGAPNEWTGRKVSGFLLRNRPWLWMSNFVVYVMWCDVIRWGDDFWQFFKRWWFIIIFWVVLLWDVFLFGLGGVRFRYLLRLQLLSSQSASYPLMFIESGIERSTVLSVLLEMLILYPIQKQWKR